MKEIKENKHVLQEDEESKMSNLNKIAAGSGHKPYADSAYYTDIYNGSLLSDAVREKYQIGRASCRERVCQYV